LIHQIGRMTLHCVSQFLVSAGLESDTSRLSIPSRRRTDRIRHLATRSLSQSFFQDRLAPAELDNQRVDLVTLLRNSAVGDVIAIPAGDRIIRIEVRRLKLEMCPVTRLTRSHPPRCQRQRGTVSCSCGKLSFTRKTRRTTNKWSVMSCTGPAVNSFVRPSTYNVRIFKSNGCESPEPMYHLTAVHLLNAIACGL